MLKIDDVGKDIGQFINALSQCTETNLAALYEFAKEHFPTLSNEEFLRTFNFYKKQVNQLNDFNHKSLTPLGKLQILRNILEKYAVDGFLFSRTDEYGNEYLPLYAQRLSYLTNFTGSFGFCIVLSHKAAVFTDGRYEIQIKSQVDTTLFDTLIYSSANIKTWLEYNIKPNLNKPTTLGINLKTTSLVELNLYEDIVDKLNLEIRHFDYHFIDEVSLKVQDDLFPQSNSLLNQRGIRKIENVIPKPIGPVHHYDIKYAGKQAGQKIAQVAEKISEQGIDYYLITALDSIAWLLNIRGKDVDFNPVALCVAVLSKVGKVNLFIDPLKLSKKFTDNLPKEITLYNEGDIEQYLAQLQKNQNEITFGLVKHSPACYIKTLKKLGYSVKIVEDICAQHKGIKNTVEIKNTINAHQRDGVILTKLFYQLYQNPNIYDELNITELLDNMRSPDPLYISKSFDDIVGINGNGAIIHYRSTPATNKKLTSNDYILIDCGAQYLDGTTDVTRVLSFNHQDTEFKEHFTRVLIGHIRIANLIFKAGTKGYHMDILGRAALWQVGLDYKHGTGHGVGVFLSVHEAPASISAYADVILEEGMIVSNEPGCYLTNKYGIRLENLYLIEKHPTYKDYLCFKPLTKVPFDVKNINFNLLNSEEIQWLNQYHEEVIKDLTPHLSLAEIAWLQDFIIGNNKIGS
ncbi:putative creatinase/prolidase and M24 family metallopeptidase domain-containing aminopeptidase [Candidatus Hepatincolaceae symbiont of Richtersius coronifer]